MTRENAYRLLGLTSSCSEDEVKSAYKKLAMIHHPDKGGNENNFKLLLEAKNILMKKELPKQFTINSNRRYTTADYADLRSHLSKDRLRQMEELRKMREELAAWEKLNTTRKKEPASRIQIMSTRIKTILWSAFMLKLIICASIGYVNVGLSLITIGVLLAALKSATPIAEFLTRIEIHKK